jgi:hypothetical protein
MSTPGGTPQSGSVCLPLGATSIISRAFLYAVLAMLLIGSMRSIPVLENSMTDSPPPYMYLRPIWRITINTLERRPFARRETSKPRLKA